MTKINVLHFADIHIGMENYGHIDSSTGINTRVIDFLRRFDEVIDYGLNHDVDLVIFAGDAFKTRDPSPTLQREFARRVKRIVDADVPLVMLVGNHDLPAMEKKASSIDIYRTLGVLNVMIGRDVAVLKSVLSDGPWDYVALGHVHKHQSLNEGRYPALVYSGSLERIDFGEEKEAKGFCWIELEKGNTTWQFVEVKARPFVTINLDVRDEDAPTLAAQGALAQFDVTDAIVRVNVRMRPEQD